MEHFHCDCARIISFYGPRGFQSGIKWECRWSFKSSFEHFSKGSLINLLFQGHTVRINLPLVYYRTVFTVGWKAEISRWITRRQMRKLRVYLGHVTHLSDIRGWYQWHRWKGERCSKVFSKQIFFRNISHFCLRDLSANYHKGVLLKFHLIRAALSVRIRDDPKCKMFLSSVRLLFKTSTWVFPSDRRKIFSLY